MEKENSFAMEMLKELSQQNKSMVNIIVKIIIIFSILLLSTNMGWVWYMNQYDYTTETYTADSEDYGTAIINEGGEINIGEGDEDN